MQPTRNDYGRLLSHYEWLADASASLTVPPPKDLIVRVVKASDRWRQLDPEAQDVPNRAASHLAQSRRRRSERAGVGLRDNAAALP